MRRPDLSLVRRACLLLAVALPTGLVAQDLHSIDRVIPGLTANATKSAPSKIPAKIPALQTQKVIAPTSEASAQLPDSPGAEWEKMRSDSQSANAPQRSNTHAQQQTDSNSQNQAPERPLGTAAAESPKVSGITAAEPAGVAIAPAKQRRVRTIVLKVGAIIGAAAALGTVIALTEGTSSKPPGAH